MSAVPDPQPRFDAWGLPIILTDPPALDPELGLTADEDGDWTPPATDMPITRFLLLLTSGLLIGGLTTLRTAAIRTGLYRRNRYL